MAQDNPFDQFDAGRGGVIVSDPYKARQDARETAGSARDEARTESTLRNQQQDYRFGPMERTDKLRAQYDGQQQVKEYRAAISSLITGLQSAPDGAGDNALIYAYAKAMDPGSVVRESEMGMVSSTRSMIEAAAARVRKEFGLEGGGQLSPENRARLRREMINKVGQLARGYQTQRQRFESVAKSEGLDPAKVIGPDDFDMYRKDFEQYQESQRKAQMNNRANTGASIGDPNEVARMSAGERRFSTEVDRRYAAEAKAAFDAGASRDQMDAVAAKYNAPRFGADLDAAIRYRDNPNIRHTPANAPTFNMPQSGYQAPSTLGKIVDTPYVAPAALAYANNTVVPAMNLAGMNPNQGAYDAASDIVASEHPYQYFGGAGGAAFTGSTLFGKGLGAAAKLLPAGSRAAAAIASPLAADVAYSSYVGAGQHPEDPLKWAGIGAVTGGAGSVLGSKVLAPALGAVGGAATRRVRGMMGRTVTQPLAPADQTMAAILGKVDPINVRTQLDEAAQLGVPMTLADTHPELASLAGASVRRSPTADLAAQEALLPRSRGQIDRFRGAVQRDLGPTANIPQLSEQLTKEAQAAAAPLYKQAYEAPAVGSPEISSLLDTPFGRSALSRAQGIAANERRDPKALGFGLDENGDVILNPLNTELYAAQAAARTELDAAQAAYREARAGNGDMDIARMRMEGARDALRQADDALKSAPTSGVAQESRQFSPQTLDYVKRGMDDVLEEKRNPITNRLVLDEAGRAQNGVRANFLNEVDRLNPAYGEARKVYSGPVQSRDALARGQDAFTESPDLLGIQVANQSPEHLNQMRLGYRDSLMKAADKVRYSSNPFDATLGTPVAEQRLATLYPDGTGNAPRLLRTRDLESKLARTTNEILGNSKTAQRQLADQAFEDGMGQKMLEAGMDMAMGQVPIGLVVRRGMFGSLKDRARLGFGKKAVEKADAIAPVLLNPNPKASAQAMDDILARAEAYRAATEQSRRKLGMFGRAAAMGAGSTGQQLLLQPKY